jgi:hypothetical protein
VPGNVATRHKRATKDIAHSLVIHAACDTPPNHHQPSNTGFTPGFMFSVVFSLAACLFAPGCVSFPGFFIDANSKTTHNPNRSLHVLYVKYVTQGSAGQSWGHCWSQEVAGKLCSVSFILHHRRPVSRPSPVRPACCAY